MDTDPNEIHAFLRVCQDHGLLEEIDQLCAQRITALNSGGKGLMPEQAFLQTTQHGAGALQVPMTGPCAPLGTSGTVAGQARINQELVEDITTEGRLVPAAPVPTEVDIGEGAEGAADASGEEEDDDEEEGKDKPRHKAQSTRRRAPTG